jgi:molecular chaperone DnaK
MRNRVDYGIDLGTTNSALARMENGESVIKKSEFQKDTTASAVAFGKNGKVQVGDSAYNQLRSDRLRSLVDFKKVNGVFVEVKRTMGTDERYAPDIAPDVSMSSEQLSAEILKKLKSYISDETVHAAVITIPAEFSVKQQQATKKAGELAGFTNCQLLQEPVAAAMAFATDGKFNDGKFLVFDFGGGTFDSALVVSKVGSMNVSDTEGDNYLGGKDLDYAIVDALILPHLQENFAIDSYLADPGKRGMIRDAMKSFAEELKIQLSFSEEHNVQTNLREIPMEDEHGEELEIDLTVTRDELKAVVAPIFQRAIDKALTLLIRNGLNGADLQEVVLVGGPTLSPILREMISEQIRTPNTSVDPMTAVARGAAIFASTIEVGDSVQDLQKKEVASSGNELLQLDAKYEATSVLDEEVVVLKPKAGMERSVQGCKVELKRTGWASGQLDLKSTGALIDVTLEQGKANVFEVIVTNEQGNVLTAQPSSITILQGTKVGGSPLPNNLGIEVWNERLKKAVLAPLKGAEKGRPLPVTGIANRLRTTQELRPGDMSTELHIRVYEGGFEAVGKSTIYCEHVADFMLSGGEIGKVIPNGTEFDLTVKTEPTSSIPELVLLSFLTLDMDFELTVPANTNKDDGEAWFKRELVNAREMIRNIQTEGHSTVSSIHGFETRLSEVEFLMKSANDRGARVQAVERLKELLRELEGVASQQEWPKAEAKMDEELSDLIQKNAESGNEQTTLLIKDFERKVQQVKARKDASAALLLADEMIRAYVGMTPRDEMLKGFLAYCYHEFATIQWTDTGRARAEVEAAAQLIIQHSPSLNAMQRHAAALDSLIDRARTDGNVPPIPM